MKKCCLCGKSFDGWGNNPYPLAEEGECCDKCNDCVIWARYEIMNKPAIPQDKIVKYVLSTIKKVED